MAILPVRKYPDPVLKEPGELVKDFNSDLHKLLDDMAETMYYESGIGLAAPQVGVTQRITVIDVSPDEDQIIELINPEITARAGKIDSEEGCLSIPEFRDKVTRNETVTVSALDRNGESFELEAEGLLAICLQHEIDHLDGILFIDRLSRLKRELFKRWLKKRGPFEEDLSDS